MKIGQQESLIPKTQLQGEAQMEDNKTEESGLATKAKEQIAIQTLVTLPTSTSPISSQTLQRPSIHETPL